MLFAQLAQAQPEGVGLLAPRVEVAQISQHMDGLIVIGRAFRRDEGVNPLPQLRLLTDKAIKILRTGSRLLTLTARLLLCSALGLLAASRLRPLLSRREELSNR